jgi:hypothetical protein
MLNKLQNNRHILLVVLITLDLVVILLHVFLGQYSLFNLDREANIPTIYQGLKLLIFCHLYALFIFTKDFLKYSRMNQFVCIFALSLALFISLDEMAMLHENVPSMLYEFAPEFSTELDTAVRQEGYQGSFWLVFYAPLMFVAGIIFATQIKTIFKYTQYWFIAFIAAIILLFSVPVLESVSTAGITSGYEYLMVLEESFELIGMTLLCYCYYLFFKALAVKGTKV